MKEIKLTNQDNTKYAVAHNNEIFHYLKVTPGQTLSTGLPELDVFDTEDEAKQKYPEFKVEEIAVDDDKEVDG